MSETTTTEAPTETFEIRHRWLDRVMFTCELPADISALGVSFKLGFAIKKALTSGADLHGADLGHANLGGIKADFLAAVLWMPNELDALRSAIVEGRIDGSTYSGACSCLAGTLAQAHGETDYNGHDIGRFVADSHSPREVFFTAIRPGDTPETNGASAIALAWTDEAIAIRDAIRGVKAEAV